MTDQEQLGLNEVVAELSNSAALIYTVAATLNPREELNRVSAKMLEGALMAVGKHLDDLSKEVDRLTIAD